MHLKLTRVLVPLLLALILPTAMSAEQKQTFSVLGRDDLVHMERQRAFVYELTQRLGIPTRFSGTRSDLKAIQKILNAELLASNQTWELQSLGVVLGDVFAHEKSLRWVIVEDEYGRDPALRYKNTSNLVFPLTMISKRIEEGKPIDVQAIFDGVSDYIDQFTE